MIKRILSIMMLCIIANAFQCGIVAQNSISQNLKLADSIFYSKPDSSYAISLDMEERCLKAKDTRHLVTAKNYLARYLILKSSLEEAIIKLNEAIAISSENDFQKELAYAYKLKAILLKRLNKISESIELQEKAIAIYRATHDKKGHISSLLNISLTYVEAKQFKLAEQAFLEIERYDTLANDDYYFHQNKGILQLAQKHYEEANKEFFTGLSIAQKNNMYDSQATVLMKIGECYRQSKQYENATTYLLQSEALCHEKNMQHELVETYEELILLYQETKNYEQAYHFLKKQTALKNDIVNLDKINKINELEKKLTLSEKEKEISKEKEKTQQANSQKSKLIYGLLGIGLLALLLVFLFYRTTKLKNQIQLKSSIIEESQKEILDSIHYAQRIQKGLLQQEQFLKENIKDHFILFQPKDIVSGDFYWSTKISKMQAEVGKKIPSKLCDLFYLAVCDSTGHGVPGAFMSLLNMSFFSEAINEREITKPHEVFNYIRERLIKTISSDGAKDGMDGVLLCFNKTLNTFTYSAANNAPVLIRNNQIMELPKDRMPIGKGELTQSFTLQTIDVNEGDVLYFYTDGYADQFGGEKGKKFKYKQLNNLLLKIHQMPLPEQAQMLKTTFDTWKGNLEQVDDVLVVGIKI